MLVLLLVDFGFLTRTQFSTDPFLTCFLHKSKQVLFFLESGLEVPSHLLEVSLLEF